MNERDFTVLMPLVQRLIVKQNLTRRRRVDAGEQLDKR